MPVKFENGTIYASSADGVRFELGTVDEDPFTGMDDISPETVKKLGRSGPAHLTIPCVEFTCPVRLNRRVVYQLMTGRKWRPKHRIRNEGKAARMVARGWWKQMTRWAYGE